MKHLLFAKLGAIFFSIAIFVLGGCQKKDVAREKAEGERKVEKQRVGDSSPSLKPAEPNSFEEVAARLDRGGALYFYLSTEQWLAGLSQQIASLRDVILSSTGLQSAPDSEKAARGFNIATNLVKKSGLEEITGLGASSFAVERGVYRNKLFVHHYRGKGTGFIWSAFGKAPHGLTPLELLPADTAMASFSDLDLAQLVGIARQEVEESGIPEAKQTLDQVLTQFSAMAGMPIDEVLQSLGGSVGLVLTLDPSKPIPLPIPDRTESIPTPRLAMLVQVKDDRIFKQIDKMLATNPSVVRVDEPDLKMRTMAVPAMPQLEVRATAAQWGTYLVLASDDKLIRDMMAAQKAGNGLKSTPEFAKLAADLPTEGNGFQITTQRFAETWNRFQTEMVKNQAGSTPQQTALMGKLLAYQRSGAAYAVSSHVENGWLVVGKGAQGASQVATPLLIAPAAIGAAVALPAFAKAKEKAKATKSLNQVRQMVIACKLYAQENEGKFPPSLEVLVPDYLTNPEILTSPFAPNVSLGYSYTAGLTDTSPAKTVLLEDKFAVQENQRIIGYVDGSAEVTAEK